MSKIKFVCLAALQVAILFSAPLLRAGTTEPRFQKVIYIVLENKDYRDVLKNTYFKNWAAQGASFTKFFAQTHPSQPNYIAMIAGDTLGVNSNSNVTLNEKHLGDLLEEKHFNWRVYAEDFPRPCYLDATSGAYARRHVPFLSFKNVQQNSQRCARIMNFSNMEKDWKDGKLAEFNMVIPNNKSNGHDTNIAASAAWIHNKFNSFLKNPQLMKDTLVIITYDEGSYTLKNQIYTVLLGPSINPGSTNTDKHTHYSLLRMIEDEWGLNSLGRGDQAAPSVLHIWK